MQRHLLFHLSVPQEHDNELMNFNPLEIFHMIELMLIPQLTPRKS